MQPESEFRQFRSFFERVFSALHHLAFDQCLVLAEAFERHELDLTSPRSTQKLRRLVSKVLNSLASQVHAELEPIGLRKETRHAALPLPQWIGDLRNPCVAEEVKAAPNLKLDPRARIGPVASSSQPLHPDDRVRFNLVAGAFAREWARHRLWAERGPIEVWSHPQSQELDDQGVSRVRPCFLFYNA